MMMNSMGNTYYEAGAWSSVNPNNNNSRNRTARSSSPSNYSNDTVTNGAVISSSIIPLPLQVPLPLMLISSSSSPVSLSPSDQDHVRPCKSHKEAERRRRKRINAHLATLRSLLPNLLKTDKASVLGEVVRRVRELKKAASELTADVHGDGDASVSCVLPGDMDDVKLCRSENDGTILVATLCCEDRPELIVDLTRALRSVKGKVVRAEMATVGGRTKSVLWVRGVSGGGNGSGGGVGPEGLLRRALKVVVDKPSSSGVGMGHHGLMVGSRIQRPYYY